MAWYFDWVPHADYWRWKLLYLPKIYPSVEVQLIENYLGAVKSGQGTDGLLADIASVATRNPRFANLADFTEGLTPPEAWFKMEWLGVPPIDWIITADVDIQFAMAWLCPWAPYLEIWVAFSNGLAAVASFEFNEYYELVDSRSESNLDFDVALMDYDYKGLGGPKSECVDQLDWFLDEYIPSMGPTVRDILFDELDPLEREIAWRIWARSEASLARKSDNPMCFATKNQNSVQMPSAAAIATFEDAIAVARASMA
jgi:hypothetical protein